MPIYSNEKDALAALAKIVAEIPAAKRSRFEAIYKAWAAQTTAATQVREKLASGGRAGIYSPFFADLQAKAAAAPVTAAKLRAEFPRQADRAMSIGVKTGLGAALLRDWGPMVLAAAAVATVGYSGVLSSSTYGLTGAQVVSAPTTVAQGGTAAAGTPAAWDVSGLAGLAPSADSIGFLTPGAVEASVAGVGGGIFEGIGATSSILATTAVKNANTAYDLLSGTAKDVAVTAAGTAATVVTQKAITDALGPKPPQQPATVQGGKNQAQAQPADNSGMIAGVLAVLGILAAFVL